MVLKDGRVRRRRKWLLVFVKDKVVLYIIFYFVIFLIWKEKIGREIRIGKIVLGFFLNKNKIFFRRVVLVSNIKERSR